MTSKKVNKIFCVTRKGTEEKTEGIIWLLYKAGVCPHCEYYVQVSFPQVKRERWLETEKGN